MPRSSPDFSASSSDRRLTLSTDVVGARETSRVRAVGSFTGTKCVTTGGCRACPQRIPAGLAARASTARPARRVGLVGVGPGRDHGREQAGRVRRPLGPGPVVELHRGIAPHSSSTAMANTTSPPRLAARRMFMAPADQLHEPVRRAKGQFAVPPGKPGGGRPVDALPHQLQRVGAAEVERLRRSRRAPPASKVTGPSVTRTQRDRRSNPCSKASAAAVRPSAASAVRAAASASRRWSSKAVPSGRVGNRSRRSWIRDRRSCR